MARKPRKKRKQRPVSYGRRNAILRRMGFESYAVYRKSDLWKGIRKRVFELHGKNCWACGLFAYCVHHKNYDEATLTGETLVELVPICVGCHNTIEFTPAGKKRSLAKANAALETLRSQRITDQRLEVQSSPLTAVNNVPATNRQECFDSPPRLSDDERPRSNGIDFLGELQREEKESCGDACLLPGVQLSTDSVCGRGRCATSQHKSAIGNVITHDLIAKGMSDGGGWTREQLKLIGVSWPPVTGWKDRVIGNGIGLVEAIRFIQLKNTSKKMKRKARGTR